MNLIYVYNTCIHTIVLRYPADKSFEFLQPMNCSKPTVANCSKAWFPLFPTNFWSLLKFISIELVMLFNHLILCYPLLLLSDKNWSLFFFRYVSYFHSNHSIFCWGNIFKFYHCFPSWIMLLLLYLKTHHQTQGHSDFLLCFHLEDL